MAQKEKFNTSQVLQIWRLGGQRFQVSKELSVADQSVVDLTLDSLDLGKGFLQYPKRPLPLDT